MFLNHTTQEIPYGYCHCGCGQKTQIARINNKSKKWVKGEPARLIWGHRERKPVADRFWQHVTPGSIEDCWLWQGTISAYGYGVLGIGPRAWGAHRISWELHNGPIPDDLFACHKCDVRRCVNPHHLFLGTAGDNIHDMDAKGRRVTRSNPLKGEASTSAKLSVADVVAIRKLCTDGISQSQIACRFGVSSGTISDIHCRRTWAHLP